MENFIKNYWWENNELKKYFSSFILLYFKCTLLAKGLLSGRNANKLIFDVLVPLKVIAY